MAPQKLCRLLLWILSASIVVSCKESEPEGEVVSSPEQVSETVVSQPEVEPEKEEKRVEPSEPELLVVKEEGRIVLSGALRSRVQIEEMEQMLGEAFSGTKIENNLVHDSNRHGVGWGNRVTESFLIPYLFSVKNASIQYKEGVVTLKGQYENPGELKRIQEQAILVFSGEFTKDIDNQMELAELSFE